LGGIEIGAPAVHARRRTRRGRTWLALGAVLGTVAALLHPMAAAVAGAAEPAGTLTLVGGGPGDGPADQLGIQSNAVGVGAGQVVFGQGNVMIKRLDTSTGLVHTVVGGGEVTDLPTGKSDPPLPPYPYDGRNARDIRASNVSDLAVGPDGALYFADSELRQVFRVEPDGRLRSLLGVVNGPYPSTATVGHERTLDGPISGLSWAPDGRLAVATARSILLLDVATDQVQPVLDRFGDGFDDVDAAPDGTFVLVQAQYRTVSRFDPATGTMTVIAGNGTGSDPGDGGPAIDATFAQPTAVAVAPSGDIYVVDQGRHTLRRISAATGTITHVMGDGSESGTPTYGAPAATSPFPFLNGRSSLHATADAVYLPFETLPGGGIAKIDLASGVITRVAGNGTDLDAYGLPARDARLRMNAIAEAVDGSVLYSSDIGIGRIGANGLSEQVAPERGTQVAQTPDGAVWFTTSFGLSRRADGVTSVVVSGDGGNQQFHGRPISLAPLPDSSVVVLGEYGVVTKVSSSGERTVVAGGVPLESNEPAPVEGIPATSHALLGARSIATNDAGDLFIAETQAGRVLRVDHTTGTLSTVVGKLARGDGDTCAATPAEGIQALDLETNPMAIAVRADGAMLLIDCASVVRYISPGGAVRAIFDPGRNQGITGDPQRAGEGGELRDAQLLPQSVAFSADGGAYLTDERARVWKVSEISNAPVVDYRAPSAPTNVSASVNQDTRDVVVTWDPPADPGGRPISQWKLTATASGTNPRIVTINARDDAFAARSVNLGSYPPRALVTVAVVAISARGTGPAATATAQVPAPPPPPDPVTAAIAPGSVDGSVLVTWVDAPTGPTPTAYRVAAYGTVSGRYVEVPVGQDDEAFTTHAVEIRGFRNAEVVMSVVYASNANGASPNSELVSTVAPGEPPPEDIPPVVHITSPADPLYLAGAVPAADFECSDEGGSGLASCDGLVDPGGPVADGGALPQTPGTYTLTLTGADHAGNTSSTSRSYTVVANPFGSITPIDGVESYWALDCVGRDCWAAVQESGGDGRAEVLSFHDGALTATRVVPESGGVIPTSLSCGGDRHACLMTGVSLQSGFDAVASQIDDGSPGELFGIAPGHQLVPYQVACNGGTCVVAGSTSDDTGTHPATVTLVGESIRYSQRSEVRGELTAVACADSGACLVGGDQYGANSSGLLARVADGDLGAVAEIAGAWTVDDIACEASGSCAIVGDSSGSYEAYTATVAPGAITPGSLHLVPAAHDHEAIACPPSVGPCLAGGAGPSGEGVIVELADGEQASVAEAGSLVQLVRAIACGSQSCSAVTASPVKLLSGIPLPGPSDTIAPHAAIAAPTSGAELLVDQVATISFSCDDEVGGSGIASCAAAVDGNPIANGGALPSSAAGTHLVTVTARDGAGNTTSVGVTYAVVPGSVSSPVSGGETVSTGTEATPDVPVQTAIAVPPTVQGEVTVHPVPADESTAPSGFGFFDQQVVIEGPPTVASTPYELTFLVDASSLDGLAPADVEVFRNGARVGGCTHPTQAVPDPCVVSRGFAPGSSGDAIIRVRTSHFSTWSLGLRVRPIGASDSYAVPQAKLLTVPAANGVLVNDQAVQSGLTLAAVSLSGPAAPRVSLSSTGAFTYTPVPGFTGVDTFTYRAKQPDGGLSDPVTVSIVVTPRFATDLKVSPVVVQISKSLLSVTLFEVSARLTGPGGVPIPNAPVTFSAKGKPVCTGTTNANGIASCTYSLGGLVSTVVANGVSASYDGSDLFFGSTGKNGLIG
jgi:hypothetical protein